MTQKPTRRDRAGKYQYTPYFPAYAACRFATLLSHAPRWVAEPILWCGEYVLDLLREIDDKPAAS